MALLSLALSACTTTRGPKLYDNLTLVVKTENTLIVPTSTDREFLKIVSARLQDFTETAVNAEGDLKVTGACGPRTLRIVQDLVSVSLGSQSEYTTGFVSAKTKTQQDLHVSASITIQDCELGKNLWKSVETESGQNPSEILQGLAEKGVSEAYGVQFVRIKKSLTPSQ